MANKIIWGPHRWASTPPEAMWRLGVSCVREVKLLMTCVAFDDYLHEAELRGAEILRARLLHTLYVRVFRLRLEQHRAP